MPRFLNQISIQGNIGEVFDFITTPSHWPIMWAPWSKEIAPFIDTPLGPEDPCITEYATVFGLRHDFTWKCLVTERPRFFLMKGVIKFLGKASVFIHYDLEQRASQVQYRRTVMFSHNNFCLDMVDAAILKPSYSRISKKALQNTKRILEEGALRPSQR